MLGFIFESKLLDTTCYLLSVSSLLLHVDPVTTSLRAGFQVQVDLALCSVYVGQGSTIRYDLLDVVSHFLILCFFLVDSVGRWDQCGWSLAGSKGC